MNAERRKRITEILDKLNDIRSDVEDLQSEEQESFDNMPESLQQSDRGQATESAANSLQMAVDGFDGITSELESAQE